MLQQKQKDASILRHAFNSQMERWPFGYTELTMQGQQYYKIVVMTSPAISMNDLRTTRGQKKENRM